MTQGITISQAAAYAGVTARTIRHYHLFGLVSEPRRDSSGYRRYGSADLLRLIRVRTLAGAGIPLAEIAAILDADPDQFAAALVDAERRLTERIDDLAARRELLRQLASGDRVLLPGRAAALLEKMPGLGFTSADVDAAREGLVLVNALAPDGLDDYVAQVERGLEDPRHLELMRLNMRAGDLAPDDPQVEEIATAIAEHFIADPSLIPALSGLSAGNDGTTRRELLSHHGEDEKPAWAVMTKLIEAKLRAAGIALP